MYDEIEESIEKANDWGRKIPIKKETSDGRMITYWVSPEELNQGKMQGQQDLFGSDEMNQGPEPESSYYSKVDKDTETYQIKPLLAKFNETNPALAKQIAKKYNDYKWGRDTRDIDIKLDYDTSWFYQMAKNHPDQADLYYQDFLESTNKVCKQLNNRKMAMARLKVGSKVNYQGMPTKIKGISDRGYPIIDFDGQDKKVTVDEIADIDELIKKISKSMEIEKTLKKSLTYSGHKLQDRTTFAGMKISVENKKGSYREGTDKDGHHWKTYMNYDYGYIRGTVGVDHDHVDCYLGPDENAQTVYIVHQNDPVTGKYDEDKVMLGFSNMDEAKTAYLKQYDRPGFFGTMDAVDIEDFKKTVFKESCKGKKIYIKKSFLVFWKRG